ncbi:DUF5694 domain-containing protein [Cytophagaceae bacterium YF14B1]|uniref:DUF5694 domain-containing protein n=1 Tax=Xanthocytophaga flava TaxID=3048013 RepID=A0AAE3QZH6_9BACT|nr:DUF5694 domain-containing protein [Xanthocytophaga flavus]MDJ1485589.1 DUF5694 domain-containing protein [Xanthocytophaga flavus]
MLTVSAPANAQNESEKIQVYLLGTFHFGKTSDTHSTPFPDLFSARRQKELEQIATSIVQAGVNKLFVERSYTLREEMDSLGKLYMEHGLLDSMEKSNEIYQVGFRAKQKNPAITIVPVDRKMELPSTELDEYEAMNPDSDFGGAFFKEPYKFSHKKKKLSESTLQEFLIDLNSELNRKLSQSDFLHYSLSYGDKSNFTGTRFTLSWYERNLIIFTNILRNIDPATDKKILILFGASHTAVLRQFFENHNRFQIIEIQNLFKENINYKVSPKK